MKVATVSLAVVCLILLTVLIHSEKFGIALCCLSS